MPQPTTAIDWVSRQSLAVGAPPNSAETVRWRRATDFRRTERAITLAEPELVRLFEVVLAHAQLAHWLTPTAVPARVADRLAALCDKAGLEVDGNNGNAVIRGVKLVA